MVDLAPVPTVKWNHNQRIQLKKWDEMEINTPCLVKITDQPAGSHLPSKLLEEDVLLHSVVHHKKVICQCVDFVTKDGQFYFNNQKFSVPLAYQGWFEILSEDGKTVSPCKTIEAIAETKADTFLVRSKVKAYLSEENGDPNYDKTRIVQKGEVLTIIGHLNITHGWRKQKKQILHCLDENGIDLYLDYKTVGQFSAMAGLANISGVHSIEGLIAQFRLPLTVRIVSGQIPRVASENERPGVFRLLEVQADTTALFLPVKSHQKLLPVSTRTQLNLMACVNMNEINKVPFYEELQKLAQLKADKYFRTMQVLVSAKPPTKNYSACTLPVRKKAHPNGTRVIPHERLTEEDILFAEVDDLYAYVRRGGVPPKPRPRSWANITADTSVEMSEDGKSTSQPVLSSNGKPRGLLAALTAGKFPSKPSSTLLRQQKRASDTITHRHSTATLLVETTELPVCRREEIIRSYIEKFKGSEESLQTEVDPYVDERHYQNFETIELIKRKGFHSRQGSLDSIISNKSLRQRSFTNPSDLNVKSPDKTHVITFIEHNHPNFHQPVQAL